MIFRSIKLINWRNFRKAEAELAPRTFIVGANASGKSNLLDTFRFLRDIAKKGGGFEEAVDDRGGVTKLRCLSAGKVTNIVIEVEAGDTDLNKAPSWKYLLEFNQDSARRPIIKSEVLFKEGKELFRRPKPEDESDRERLSQTWLQQVSKNKGFREFVRFLKTVHYSHLIPQLIREPNRVVPRTNDPFGADFLDVMKRTHSRIRQARLKKIGETLKRAVPQFEELVFDEESDKPHLVIRYKHWRAYGAWQREDQLSDGTIRLIGLLWAILEGQGPLLLEEPELSLHTGVVRKLASLIYRAQRVRRKGIRQVLISTHSYELLDDPGITGAEVLILKPTERGTEITTGKDDFVIKTLLEQGATVANAAFPKTEPETVAQLGFGW